MAGQPFAYQNSPTTLGLYLEILRGAEYPNIDMTEVDSCTVQAFLPGCAGVPVTWSMSIVAEETTASMLVVRRAWVTSEMATLGVAHFVAYPRIGAVALPRSKPIWMPIKPDSESA